MVSGHSWRRKPRQSWSESESRSVMSDSLQLHGLHSPWNSPGQNTGVGSLSLLQGIFPTQGLNPGLPHCRQILYQLSQKGSPRILEWVAYCFSSRSARPRNRTGLSCITDGFFTNWAIREVWVNRLPVLFPLLTCSVFCIFYYFSFLRQAIIWSVTLLLALYIIFL